VNKRVKYATTNQLTLSYIELSPTFSFKASDKLALNFGPSVSYLISEDYTITSAKTSGEDATGVNVLLDGLYESTALDIGLNLGLSYFITANFIVDTKVSTGFMKIGEVIQPNEKTDPDPAYTLKNRAIVLSLAYLF
jgi:long-subunit fatty acid transport protein